MKPGGGKQKGSLFERRVCVTLSLWITNGQRKDCLWRSAMSGGRATVHGRSVRQAGDVCAVAAEGNALCDRFYIECRHYKSLDFHGLISGRGKLFKFWKEVDRKAEQHGKEPMLITRQSVGPTIVCLRQLWGLYPNLELDLGEFDSVSIYRLIDFITLDYAQFMELNRPPIRRRLPLWQGRHNDGSD